MSDQHQAGVPRHQSGWAELESQSGGTVQPVLKRKPAFWRRAKPRPKTFQQAVDVTSARLSDRDAKLGDPRARFPYMFDGPHVGLVLYRGWVPILVRACEKIDQIVVLRGLKFHWVCLREENGTGWFFYSLNDRSRFLVDIGGSSRRALVHVNSEVPTTLTRRIDAIVCEAERLASEACLVCGARCTRARYFGQELPLCSRHCPDQMNEQAEEGLESVWRLSIEWEAP